MKILFISRYFYPSIGGSETNAEILASEFTALGHEVKVVTQTSVAVQEANTHHFPFSVIRQPNALELLRLVHWCDVCLHNGINLRLVWPLLLFRRPWIIRHQIWLRSINGELEGVGGNPAGWLIQLKHFATRFATSIAISEAMAEHLHCPSIVIPNPYRDELFQRVPEIAKTRELVFVGRLVSEKGVNLLLQALAQLKQQALTPVLTIVGTGPEESFLRKQTVELALSEQVDFVGTKTGLELVRLLNKHEIIVIPSIYNEPFGVVALEGIACGCVAVGSAGGGLKDAIGTCGLTFANGDVDALARILSDLLTNPQQLDVYRAKAQTHLAHHHKTRIAKDYLKIMEKALH